MSDVSPNEPPRSVLIKWLKFNLAFTITAAGAVSTIGGLLISGTLSVAHYDNRLEALETLRKATDERLRALESDSRERDGQRLQLANDLNLIGARIENLNTRLNSADQRQQAYADWIIDAGKRWQDNASHLAAIDNRLGILEERSRFLGNFIDANGPLIRPPGARR